MPPFTIATCRQCGNTFHSYKMDTLYCSNACKQKAYRARIKAEKRPGNVTRKTSPGAKTCPHCGRKFTPGRKDAMFCKASCRKSANRMKVNLTIQEMTRGIGAYPGHTVMSIAQDEGWAVWYRTLENRGMYYSYARRGWSYVSDKTLFDLTGERE